MKEVNAINHIRGNPEMYLRAGRVHPVELVEQIVGDLFHSNATTCSVQRHGAWWCVTSVTDWLSHSKLSPEDLFHRIVPMPEAGANSMRHEVLLTAFTSDVVIATPDNVKVIVGQLEEDSLVDEVVKSLPGWNRLVGFKCRAEPTQVI